MQQVGSKAVDLVGVNTRNDELANQKQLAELVTGIRIDSLPASDAKRLAKEGHFYPLTLDENGQLRVVLQPGTKVVPEEIEVLLRIEALLIEQRELLMNIAQ